MPANEQIKEKDLLLAGVRILKKCGSDSLNARTIAKEAGCSTQPIYRLFKNMSFYERRLYDFVRDISGKYMQNEVKSGKYPPYKSFGMGYIRFAREQKALYSFLYMRGFEATKSGDVKDETDEMTLKSVELISKNTGLSYESAYKLHLEVWIFCHGIASMAATSFIEWKDEDADKMITDVYTALVDKFKNKEELFRHVSDKNG